MNTPLLESAINDVRTSLCAFCRYITANDVGETGSHQSGFYIPKDSWKVFFDTPGVKGSNMDNFIRIEWNNDFHTDSRAIYYGKGTRDEYRLTCFGKGFPLLEKQYSGSLIVVAKMAEREYKAYVLCSDSDIDAFISTFDISPFNKRHFIETTRIGLEDELTSPELRLKEIFERILAENPSFPSTALMSELARSAKSEAFRITEKDVISNPDSVLVDWIDIEYQLFSAFEERDFAQASHSFADCHSLIDFSNSLLNRRKARAGKSLEHHLAHVFTLEKIKFEEQVVTEGNKKPDFIFPDGLSYHNLLFPVDGLTFLGAKTTCKDRWRQVLNEANRIPHKYLFTLQQGISSNQLEEMKQENLTLVVPKSNINTFAESHRQSILSLGKFINIVREKQDIYCP